MVRRIKCGPKEKLPGKEIALLSEKGYTPTDIAQLLELSPKQIYNKLYEIKSDSTYKNTMSEIRKHLRARLMAYGRPAVDALGEITMLDPRDQAPAAMAIGHASEKILDRIGLGVEKQKSIVNIQLNLTV